MSRHTARSKLGVFTANGEPQTIALQDKGGNRAQLRAEKQRSLIVEEQGKPLADYMALPASQYSVLDAKKIERLSDTTFRCFVGRLRFFSWEIEPVLTVSVQAQDRGCTIKLLSTELQGSKIFEDMNKLFDAEMTNIVSWRVANDTAKEIISNTELVVSLEVPDWFKMVPKETIEKAGSRVLQTTLNIMVPRFLQQLKDDYGAWALGDSSRKPLGTGQL